jgi:single-strand DNA-binding protein
MNRVELAGGLPRDPEVRALSSGTLVCEFTVAVREAWSYKDRLDKVRTNFIGCVAWGDLAQYAADHFHKGDEVYLLGQLTQEEYEGRDSKKVSKTKVRVITMTPTRRASARPEPDDQPAEGIPEF